MPFAAIIGAVAAPVIGSMLSDDNGAGGTNAASADASRTQAQIGREQWDRYKQVGAPLEDQFINESQGLGSIANQNKNAQTAAAGVAAGFAGARDKLNHMPGLTPETSNRENNRLNLTEAATSAGAQTVARDNTVKTGRAAMSDAVSLTKGLPGQAVSALGSGATGLSGAGQYLQNRADAQARGIGQVTSGIFASPGVKKWLNDSFSSASSPGMAGWQQGLSTGSTAAGDVLYG